MLEHLQGGMTMQPRIITREAEMVVGMGGSFQQGDSDSIGKLWDSFIPRTEEIAKSKPYAIGLCTPKHPSIPVADGDHFVYIAGLPVESADGMPPGMVSAELPAGRYAVFTHKGPISAIKSTISYIWGTWLPKSEYAHREAPDFELYDERFSPNSADSEFDFYIPIE
jgi:AraC family transcriptional regulator